MRSRWSSVSERCQCGAAFEAEGAEMATYETNGLEWDIEQWRRYHMLCCEFARLSYSEKYRLQDEAKAEAEANRQAEKEKARIRNAEYAAARKAKASGLGEALKE